MHRKHHPAAASLWCPHNNLTLETFSMRCHAKELIYFDKGQPTVHPFHSYFWFFQCNRLKVHFQFKFKFQYMMLTVGFGQSFHMSTSFIQSFINFKRTLSLIFSIHQLQKGIKICFSFFQAKQLQPLAGKQAGDTMLY